MKAPIVSAEVSERVIQGRVPMIKQLAIDFCMFNFIVECNKFCVIK